MPNFFYNETNGQKKGPVTEQQLQDLIDQRLIEPNTPLEMEGGHKGMAGQIPGLRFASDTPQPKQLFCTNCGTAVSEQAIACMSCGAKPTGHRKFCRQCGTALNPEQVVCIKCGAEITAGYSGGAKRVVLPVISASNIEKAKNLVRPVVFSGIAVAAGIGLVWFAVNFWPSSHPLKRAKPGDWARYDVIVSKNGAAEEITFLLEILSNDHKKVGIRTTTVGSGRFGRPEPNVDEGEIDLSKSPKEIEGLMLGQEILGGMRNVKIEKGKTTKEKLLVAGKSINCIIIPTTGTMTAPDGASITITGTEWRSKTVPAGGLVRIEQDITKNTRMETETMTMTMKLAAFGNDPEIVQKVGLRGKAIFSDDRSPVPIGTVCFETDSYLARGDLRSDGTFVVGSLRQGDGLPPGRYRVYISGAQKPIGKDERSGMEKYESLIDLKFTSGTTSGIEIDVTPTTRTVEVKVDRYNAKIAEAPPIW